MRGKWGEEREREYLTLGCPLGQMKQGTTQVHLVAEVHNQENWHCIPINMRKFNYKKNATISIFEKKKKAIVIKGLKLPLSFYTQDVYKDDYHQEKVDQWIHLHSRRLKTTPDSAVHLLDKCGDLRIRSIFSFRIFLLK